MLKKLSKRFPPLYVCSKCGKTVKVISVKNKEAIIKRKCKCPDDTIVFANRKVILEGKGDVNNFRKVKSSVVLNIRKLLSKITGRSV